MKYKKHIATGALAISLLVGGSSVFASSPQDLGIKTVQPTYQRHLKGIKNIPRIKKNSIVGTITIINDTGFTVEVKNRKSKSVSTVDVKTDNLTIYSENGIHVTKANLAVGQKVVVSGTLDKVTNTLVAKKVKIAMKHMVKAS